MEWNCCGIKPLALFLTFFLVLGSGLILFGVLFGVLGPKTPSDPKDIARYNTLAKQWQTTNRDLFESFNFNISATLVNNAPIPPSPSVSSFPSPSSSLTQYAKKNTNFVQKPPEPGVVIPPSIYSRLNYQKPSKVQTQQQKVAINKIKPFSIGNNSRTSQDEDLILLDNVTMQINLDSDVYHPDNPSFLVKYDSLKYEVKNPDPSLLFNTPIRTNFDKALNISISFTNSLMFSIRPEDNEGKKPGQGITLMTTNKHMGILNGLVHSVQVPLVYLFLKTESPIYDSTNCRYGFMEDGKCYLIHRLREICLKVKLVDGIAVLDDSFGGYGCGPTDLPYVPAIKSIFSGLTYVYSLLNTGEYVYNHTVLFQDLTITLRSSNDPFVFAEYITNGTLNFQPWYHYYQNVDDDIGFVRGFFGFGSLGLGVLIVLPSLLFCLLFCCCSPTLRKKFMVDDLREEHALLLNIANKIVVRPKMVARTKSASVKAKRLFDEEQAALKRQDIMTTTSSSSGTLLENKKQEEHNNDDNSIEDCFSVSSSSSDDSNSLQVCAQSLIVLNKQAQESQLEKCSNSNSSDGNDDDKSFLAGTIAEKQCETPLHHTQNNSTMEIVIPLPPTNNAKSTTSPPMNAVVTTLPPTITPHPQQYDPPNQGFENEQISIAHTLSKGLIDVVTRSSPIPTVLNKKHATDVINSLLKQHILTVQNVQQPPHVQNTELGSLQHQYPSPYNPQHAEARSTDISVPSNSSSVDGQTASLKTQLPSLTQICNQIDDHPNTVTIPLTKTPYHHYQYTVKSSPVHFQSPYYQPPPHITETHSLNNPYGLTLGSNSTILTNGTQLPPPRSPINTPSTSTTSNAPASLFTSLPRSPLPPGYEPIMPPLNGAYSPKHYYSQPSYHYHYPHSYNTIPPLSAIPISAQQSPLTASAAHIISSPHHTPISSTKPPVHLGNSNISLPTDISSGSNNSSIPHQTMYAQHTNHSKSISPHNPSYTAVPLNSPSYQQTSVPYPTQIPSNVSGVHSPQPKKRSHTIPTFNHLHSQNDDTSSKPAQFIQDNPNSAISTKRKREYLKDIVTDPVTLGKLEYEIFMAEQHRKREGTPSTKKSKLFNMDYTNIVNPDNIRDKIEITRKRDQYCDPAPLRTDYLEILQGVNANMEYKYGDPLPDHIVKVTFGKYSSATSSSIRLAIYGRGLKDEPKERKFIQTITTFELSVTNAIAKVTFSDLTARHASHKYGKLLFLRFTLVCDNMEVSSVETEGFTTITLRGIQKRQQRQGNREFTQ